MALLTSLRSSTVFWLYDCNAETLWCWCSQAVDKADELKAQLDSKGVIYSPELLHHLALLSADHKRNLDEALSYKQQLCVLYNVLH